LNIEKITTYVDDNSYPGLGHGHKCGGINRYARSQPPPPSVDNYVRNDNT